MTDLLESIGARVSQSQTVLVVDDEPALHRLAKRVANITGFPFTVIPVYSPEEAMTLLQESHNNVSAVITDFLFTGVGMSGIEFARRIRRVYAEVKIIAYTGSELSNRFEKYFHLYYRKPTSMVSVFGGVLDLLEGRGPQQCPEEFEEGDRDGRYLIH